MRRVCLSLRANGIRCSCRTAFAVERDILARIVPSRASSMGPTSSIPHGKSMLDGDCSLKLKFSAARRVEGVSGFLAEGSPPSPSECGGMVSEGVRSHPTRVSAEVRVKVTAFVTDTIPIRAACRL